MKTLRRPEYCVPFLFCVVIGLVVVSVVAKPGRTAALPVSQSALGAGDVAGDAYEHVVRVLGTPDTISEDGPLPKHPKDSHGILGSSRLQSRTIVYTKARVTIRFMRDRPIDGRPRKWWLCTIADEQALKAINDQELAERLGVQIPLDAFVHDDIDYGNPRLAAIIHATGQAGLRQMLADIRRQVREEQATRERE